MFHRDIRTLWARGSDGVCNIAGRDELWNYKSSSLPPPLPPQQATSGGGNPPSHANAALLCRYGRKKILTAIYI